MIGQEIPCPQCRGTGWAVCGNASCAHSCHCSLCAGIGRVRFTKVILAGGLEAEIALPLDILGISLNKHVEVRRERG